MVRSPLARCELERPITTVSMMAEPSVPSVPFHMLWKNYPDSDPCVNKDGKPPPGWTNQCAVRLSTALTRSGVSLESFKGGVCPVAPAGIRLAGSAEQLAAWLSKKQRLGNMSPTAFLPPQSFEKAIAGRTGIIFFKDYWRRRGEHRGPGSGDHIDLWNRDTMTSRFVSFLRFTLGLGSVRNYFGDGNWFSDLHQSSQVLFWHIW